MKSNWMLILVIFLFTHCKGKQESAIAMNHIVAMQNENSHHRHYSRTDTTRLILPDSVWRQILDKELYDVARQAATERAFTGKYWDYEGIGTYFCAACGNPLFKSDSKFASGCGWPSFFESIRPNSISYKEDRSYGIIRVEVLCGRCDAHLGHIFDDGPAPTGKRFCMNSISLDFEKEE